MTSADELLAKIAKENRDAEKKRPGPTAEQVESNARFLRSWCKGKPIVRQSADSTFWAAGKWMTKMDAKMAVALVAAGHATLTGLATDRGARLVMKKEG